jgi:hypothetical protein
LEWRHQWQGYLNHRKLISTTTPADHSGEKSDLVWNGAGSWRPNFELNKRGDRQQDYVSKTHPLSQRKLSAGKDLSS